MYPIEHIIRIDKKSKMPIYRQIAISIINAIKNGYLKAGDQLPGSRDLADSLNLHRKTIIAAYEELYTQDWISMSPRKRATISESIPNLKASKWEEFSSIHSYDIDFNLPFNQYHDVDHSVEENTVIPDIIIDDGFPDIRLSPISALLKTYRSYVTRTYSIKNANLENPQGTLALREQLVNYLSETRGLIFSKENILITHGAQMSIYLSAQLLLNKKAKIVVAKPNYPKASQTFSNTGAKVLEIGIDEKGLKTDELESLCKTTTITAVYVISHHHYPTTVTLSVDRRVHLLELSKQYHFAIIEDDYDFDYHYTTPPYLPLASGGHNGNIIYIGSFSKILGPSIRIGFMVAPKNFIQQCVELRKTIDVGNDAYMQNSLANLIKEGEFTRYFKKAKKFYQERLELLDQLLKKELNKYISYTLPTGGMAVWIKVDKQYPISAIQNLSKLRIKHISKEENAFRFGFASLNEKEILQAIHILKDHFIKHQ
ncbi:aminotransferase-like domain-containing protein [Myroides odoratimimus]|uniref:aminotransferase-like domain-containing protein n=1 Tax=Myroides odoratimimus TaxID=76832 RepID=UPI0002DFDCB7|nr:PLP-dependent aminotransferase family protein [Myroides odoratimimus]